MSMLSSISMCPPCSSVKDLAMASPIPVPVVEDFSAVSMRKKGVKIFSRIVDGIILPSFITVKTNSSSSFDSITDTLEEQYFTALFIRLLTILVKAS